jgi:hypothetical protein
MKTMLVRRARASGAVLVCASLAACFTTVGKWTYPSGRYPTSECEQSAHAFVAVEPFLDVRSDTNKSWIAWAYVPLSPLGWTHFDRPEATVWSSDTTHYEAFPCDDLARSIVTELRREHVCEQAELSADRTHDTSCTHILRGKLRAFYVHESRFTYGLSVYAVFLWGIGLPVGRSHNGFCVDLELADARDGRTLWRGSVYDSDAYTEGLYYGPEWYRFAWMWELRLREKMGEIATALGTNPPPLPANLSAELRRSPAPAMPECLGVDSNAPCSAR